VRYGRKGIEGGTYYRGRGVQKVEKMDNVLKLPFRLALNVQYYASNVRCIIT
jgi:hypothetical protein